MLEAAAARVKSGLFAELAPRTCQLVLAGIDETFGH
jgi:hypothetical protein